MLNCERLNFWCIRAFWIFPETAWRHMICRQAAHVVILIFLGLRMNRHAAGDELPGEVLLLLVFLSF